MPGETNGTNNSSEAALFTLQFHTWSISDCQPQFIAFSSSKFYWSMRGRNPIVYTRSQLVILWSCYNTGPTRLIFPVMYAFISLQGLQNICGWANGWKWGLSSNVCISRVELSNSDESWFYLHLGTMQFASLQCFEWHSRSFHMKTHLLQPPQLRARVSHRTPWKNNFFKVKQTWTLQLYGSKHLDACTRPST